MSVPLRIQLQTEVVAARRACDQAPEEAARWAHLGRTHTALEAFADAAACFAQIVRIDARNADGWHNLGTALKKLGKPAEALEAFRNALRIDPARAITYLNLGNLLIESDQFADAVVCFERAARLDPALAAARSRLGEQLARLGQVKKAQDLFRQSVGLEPGHVHGWMGLGRTLEDAGRAEDALLCYRNVLARRPDHASALGHYLALLRDDAPDSLLTRAAAILHSEEVRDEARALVGYGLARYRDRRGDVGEAASAANAANAARRRTAGPLDRKSLAARVDNLVATYDREFFFRRRRFGLGTDQPVFIVGLPRSGTTLCEQILSSHPQLHGAGELPDLAHLAATALPDGCTQPWEAARAITEMRSRDLAMRYLRGLRDQAPRGCLRISDKQPLNFFQLAFAALLFPNARVIHCTREARDTALSIWMENFNPDQRYATDFDDLAFLHGEYQRLMVHWSRALPLRMLEVRYEETVRDVDSQARRLIAFLDAPWDPRCLDFHRNHRAVQTPSRWQVRQPIYSSSVGRWQRYASHLPALLQAFPP